MHVCSVTPCMVVSGKSRYLSPWTYDWNEVACVERWTQRDTNVQVVTDSLVRVSPTSPKCNGECKLGL